MADDIAVLGIKVDSRDVGKADKSLDKLTTTATKTQKATDSLNKSSSKATDAIGGYSRRTGGATRATDGLSGSIVTATKSVAGMQSSVRALVTALKTFIAVEIANEVRLYADAAVNLENKLRQVTDGQRELTDVTSKLFDIANRTRAPIEDTATLYQRLTLSTSELGLAQVDLLRITETINKAFTLSGATTEEAAGAIRQLSQGLASGALRGDEFNSVAEQAPIIMRAIAEETGLTIGELREFAAEGGITADIVVNALQRMGDQIDSQFSQSVATFDQKTTLATNRLVEFADQSEGLKSAVSSAGDAVVIAAEGLAFFLENLELVATVIIARSIPSLGALVIAQRGYITTVGLATIATRGFTAALALMGGPLGVVLVAATALAAYVTSTNEVEDANDRLAKSTERVSSELEKISSLGALTQRARTVREELFETQQSLEKLEAANREVDIYGSGNLFVAADRIKELRLRVQELSAELEIVGKKQESVFEKGIGEKLKGGIELADTDEKKENKLLDDLREAVKQAEAFKDAFKEASKAQKEIESNIARIKAIGEARDKKGKEASVLGALISAENARKALAQGNTVKASQLAVKAAEELKAVEEETGKSVTLAGTFIKNFEKIAQDALRRAEDQRESLRLVIEIEGEDTREFDFDKQGVKEAGKFASDVAKRLRKAEKTNNRTSK